MVDPRLHREPPQRRTRGVRLQRSSGFIAGGMAHSSTKGARSASPNWAKPGVTYFEADDLRAKLMALGFTEVEDLGPPQIAARYFPNRARLFPTRAAISCARRRSKGKPVYSHAGPPARGCCRTYSMRSAIRAVRIPTTERHEEWVTANRKLSRCRRAYPFDFRFPSTVE